MLANKVKEILKGREYLNVATCDFHGQPNSAPKFLLKCHGTFLYLVDYTIGTTYRNLKVNPKVSLSFIDLNSLTGYQVNGSAHIISGGAEYNRMRKELRRKEVLLSTKRIIEGVRGSKKYKNFEIAIPDEIVIFKVRVKEVVAILLSGQLEREQI
ncbi:MAG: pyridoxamine 5'-phosphate oxidase family protein [Candidatus Omnitrophica bacterium]|nr:pyridoxamine 5'-phosphate oxidase family protein [Candidatus Omnitrophota bacterium]